jgi:hypothetical protein
MPIHTLIVVVCGQTERQLKLALCFAKKIWHQDHTKLAIMASSADSKTKLLP